MNNLNICYINSYMNKQHKKNRSALITGAAGLLGKQHAIALLEIGFKVVLVDVNKKKMKQVYEFLIKKFNKDKVLFFNSDITNEKEIFKLKEKLKEKKIFIDTLINNAALNPSMIKTKKEFGKLESYQIQNLKNELNVGIVGAFICTKIFGSEMAKKKFGVIINMGSDLALISPDHSIYHPNEDLKKVTSFKPAGYSISKSGLLGLTKYVGTYWADKNVRCNMLVAGGVKQKQSKFLIKNLKKRIPMKRMAKVDEYKKALQFLCSDGSQYMTGQTVVLDGGRTVW